MSKKVITAVTLALILSLFALSTQNHSVYANAAATAKATHKAEATEQPEDKDEPEGTREANTSPWCAGITPGAATPEANAPDQQPRAARIAKAYGVPYKDVIG